MRTTLDIQCEEADAEMAEAHASSPVAFLRGVSHTPGRESPVSAQLECGFFLCR